MILRILRYNRSRSSSILSSVNFYAANNGTVKYQSTTTDQDGKKRRSTGKFLLKSTALVGAGVAGGLVWLYYDTENRQKLEQYVPQSKQLLDFIYGNVNNFIGGANNTPLAIQQSGSGGIRKSLVNEKQPSPIAKAPIESSKTSGEEGKLKLTKVVDLSPPPSALPLTKQEAKHIEIQPVDIHKDAPKMELKKSADEEKEEPDLDEAFKAVVIPPLKLADEKANAAKDAKLKTIRSYQAKAKALKEAVNSGVEQSDGEAVWQRVKSAESEVEKCARMDAAAEAEARAAINALNKVISESKADPKKAKSPTIRNAVETVKKLNARLDELNYLIEKESSQLRVFSQYKQLVDKGRQQWADELKAAFPNLPAKAKEGSLTEEELNAFIVHASMHIDQLKRQLAEYQSQEEQKIANAIEEQRRIDEKLSKLHLEIESRRIREDENLSLEEKVQEERKLWEAEVEAQLKKKALAHSEHMEKIIRTQKQLHDIENAQIVEEARTLERNKFGKQIDGAVNRLNEIEQALNSRAALDLENRRAKIVWTVCQSLYESLVGTVDDQQQQYATAPLKEVKFLQELAENDDFVQSVCNCFPERAVTAGVPTENGLKRRFDRVFTLAWRTAQIDDNGGGPLQYFLSWLQSLFVFQLSAASSPDALIEPDKYEPYEFLSLIHDFAERGDFANAIRVANLLRGEPAQIFRDWVADAMLHVEARFLAELLLSHAQVSSIRTTY